VAILAGRARSTCTASNRAIVASPHRGFRASNTKHYGALGAEVLDHLDRVEVVVDDQHVSVSLRIPPDVTMRVGRPGRNSSCSCLAERGPPAYTLTMLKVSSPILPLTLPTERAIKSFGDNRHSYEPEFWEFQYETYRYLGRVAMSALADRYRALLRNMRALISSQRDVIPIQSFLSSWYWYRKEHQTRLEFAMRGAELPVKAPAEPIRRVEINAPAHPSSPNSGDVIFRYARRKWVEEMVNRGLIRVNPASSYRALEFDAARRDKEQEKTRFMPGEYSEIITKDGRRQTFVGDVRSTVSAPSYYLLSCSCEFDRELFTDFRADACAVIRDSDMFAARLETAAQKQLEGWLFHHNPVQYFDPYERHRNEYFDPTMSKDFSFAYQREYRFLWAHLGGQEADDFRSLDVGPLHDIAKIYSS